jgi:peroxiredoxin
MIRSLAVVLLTLVLATPGVAQVAAPKPAAGLRVVAKLSGTDPKDTARNTPCKIYPVLMKSGRVYTIDMVSTQFDSYLRLEDKNGSQLDEDDDSGGNLNARIVFNCSKDGEYKVICTCFNEGSLNQSAGNFTLTIKESAQAVKLLGTPHQQLLGKAAPDFHSDFAVNGKAVKLSDLKGKVVLLAFWEIQSSPSLAMLPRLRDWHKAHRDQGLALVGVTYYNFEIGQKLRFDKETGQVKRIDTANKESEQALLKAFAAYHHLDYLLLALSREDALGIFDAYVVNGLPQFVLIDRKGIVRLIRVGEDAATATAVESELKKLLAAP